MKIEIGNIYENLTKILLSPGLKIYGEGFTMRFSKELFKLAYGIGDKNSPVFNGRRPIFIMCDKAVNPQVSWKAIEWLRTKPFYITDYSCDLGSVPRKHIVVLDYPEELQNTYECFLKGEYSKMYSKEQLNLLITDKTSKAYNILTKDPKYMPVFIKQIEEEFAVEIVDKRPYISSELAFPINMNHSTMEKEIFNY